MWPEEQHKAAVEDLKQHYVEAITARPGIPPAGGADTMLWNESALGRLLRRLARAEPKATMPRCGSSRTSRSSRDGSGRDRPAEHNVRGAGNEC